MFGTLYVLGVGFMVFNNHRNRQFREQYGFEATFAFFTRDFEDEDRRDIIRTIDFWTGEVRDYTLEEYSNVRQSVLLYSRLRIENRLYESTIYLYYHGQEEVLLTNHQSISPHPVMINDQVYFIESGYLWVLEKNNEISRVYNEPVQHRQLRTFGDYLIFLQGTFRNGRIMSKNTVTGETDFLAYGNSPSAVTDEGHLFFGMIPDGLGRYDFETGEIEEVYENLRIYSSAPIYNEQHNTLLVFYQNPDTYTHQWQMVDGFNSIGILFLDTIELINYRTYARRMGFGTTHLGYNNQSNGFWE